MPAVVRVEPATKETIIAAPRSAAEISARDTGGTMSTHSAEAVVRKHLDAFVTKKGIAAILTDYDERACLHSEAKVYCGKHEIENFFVAFMSALPPRAPERFSLRSLRTDGDVAYITWSVGDEIPL